VGLAELLALLDDGLAGLRVFDVVRGALAGEQLEVDGAGDVAVLLEVDVLLLVVEVEQLLGAQAEGAQEHGRVELTSAVDADVDVVLVVELEVEPRTAVGDHAGGEQLLAGAVGLALVVIEEHTWGAVQLRDHDALGAVDDEGAVRRHQRDLTEVDLLLLDVADRLGAGLVVDVPDHQANDDLDRGREGHATGAALVLVVLGTIEAIADELEGRGLAEVTDREDALEHRLESDVLARLEGHVALQKLVVRPLLDVDEIGDLDDALELSEVLTHPEVVLNHRWHRRSLGRGAWRGPMGSGEAAWRDPGAAGG
jgi:hypothetical protein